MGEQGADPFLRAGGALGKEADPPLVDAEGFGHPIRVDARSSVADHVELAIGEVQLFEVFDKGCEGLI